MRNELETVVIKKRLMDIHGILNPKIEGHVQIPNLPLIRSLNTFFSLTDIWTTVGNISYVPRQVLAELIVRIDGNPNDQNQFSVFMSDKQEMLKDRVNLEPLTVTPKQKLQFHDALYARALLSSIVDFDNEIYQSSNKYATRTILPVYEIVDDIDPNQLRSTYSKFYSSLRNVYGYLCES